MPYFHCKDCHHEFESPIQRRCDWCGAESYVLEEETPFEEFCRIFQEGVKDLHPEISRVVNDNFWQLL